METRRYVQHGRRSSSPQLTFATQKVVNLARIRDNQRRSRARRKDYLKELETKYRNCEQVGVSASTEIQAAAKGVVEENRRLRDLLKAYGVSDAEIDGASGRQGSIAADMLEAMVNTRQPCGPGDGCHPVPDPTHQMQPASYVPLQPMRQLSASQAPGPNLHPITTAPQYLSQLPSPASLPERKHSSDTVYSPIDQGPAVHPLHGYNIPANPPPGFSGGYGEHIMSQNIPRTDAQYDGLSSCQIAADTIRTFSPSAGYELEQQLGCRAPGEDCSVSNMRIFNVIDRYTAGSG